MSRTRPSSGADDFGTVYWANSVGIKVWYFQRGSVPKDITAGAPQPQTWPTPNAFWADSSLCNIADMFVNHTAIFDTTLCGDWAEGVWGGTGVPGQSVSCQQQTGFATCAEFVQASGASFNEACESSTLTTLSVLSNSLSRLGSIKRQDIPRHLFLMITTRLAGRMLCTNRRAHSLNMLYLVETRCIRSVI